MKTNAVLGGVVELNIRNQAGLSNEYMGLDASAAIRLKQ